MIDDDLEVGTVADVALLTGLSAEAVYQTVAGGGAIDGVLYVLRKPKDGKEVEPPVPVNGKMPNGDDVGGVRSRRPEAPLQEARPGLRPVYEFDIRQPLEAITMAARQPRRTRSWPSVTAAAFEIGMTDKMLKGLIAVSLTFKDCRYSYEPTLPPAEAGLAQDDAPEEPRRPGIVRSFDANSPARGPAPSPSPRPVAPMAPIELVDAAEAGPVMQEKPEPPAHLQEEQMVTATPKHFSEIEKVLRSKVIPTTKGASMVIGGGIAGSYKNDHSRLAKQIEATDERGQNHDCRSMDAAASLTGISGPTIRKSLTSGEAVHARGSTVLWKFKLGTGAKPETTRAAARAAPAPVLARHVVSESAIGGAGGAPSLAGALAAVASMAAGIGGLVLSNVSIVAGDGRVELKIEKLEIVRG